MPTLTDYQEIMLHEFNRALKMYVEDFFPDSRSELNRIFTYHLGLEDDMRKQGKRIRPMLTLLCTQGAGGDWKKALPAAASLELIHNFSLIHDDIEDNGHTRRGKEAVWIKWGLAKGLNAGDVMFSTAFKVLEKLDKNLPPEIPLGAANLLADTCLSLTTGQQDDIGFQDEALVKVDQYYKMITGKTAALIAAACQMGTIMAGKSREVQMAFHDFGHALGTTFQIYDDWLGIWGDEKQTGKTTSGDLVESKKSLPVLLGLEHCARFKDRWQAGPINPEETTEITAWLREDGVEAKVKQAILEWNNRTRELLKALDCHEDIKLALDDFANKLIIRER
jgi:geranylgeranyl diphosphate synthase, type I